MSVRCLLYVLLLPVSLNAYGQQATQPVTPLHPAVRTALEQFKSKYGEWSFERTNGTIKAFAGASTKLPAEPDLGVQTLLKTAAQVSLARREMFSDPVIRNFDGTRQLVYQQIYKKDATSPSEPIENAYIAIMLSNNAVYDVTVHAVPATATAPDAVRKSADAAKIAEAAFLKDFEDEGDPFEEPLTKAFSGDKIAVEAIVLNGTKLIAIDRKLHRVHRVRVDARAGSGVVASIIYAIDASSTAEGDSAILQRNWLTHRAVGFARVFNPNPINTLNLCDLNSGSIPAGAFFDVSLRDLDLTTGGRYRLSGPYVRICDIEGPATMPPEVEAASAPEFFYSQNSAEFAAATAYYHLENLQQHLIDLGFKPLVRKIDVDVDGADVSDLLHANYHDWPFGDGRLSFGKMAGRFEAEDAELIAHEFGHAILSRDTAGRFGSSKEARAIGEGFSDYWAISTFFELTKQNGHRVDCFAEWIRGGRCLRTTTAKVSVGEYVPGKPSHVNGQIWSAILFDIFRVLADRIAADRIILQGHLNRAYSGSSPTMREMAEGIVRADQQYFNGRHGKRLCAVFTAHGIEDLKCCSAEGCLKPLPDTIQLVPQFFESERADHCRNTCG